MESIRKGDAAFAGVFQPKVDRFIKVDFFNISTPITAGVRLVHFLRDKRSSVQRVRQAKGIPK
jgi:hypothetical protein